MSQDNVAAATVKLGIKETKEALIGANKLSVLMMRRLKDGVGIDDAFAIYDKLKTDTEFRQALVDAYQGIEKVPAEVKDLDLNEAVELIGVQVSYVPKMIEALKKA